MTNFDLSACNASQRLAICHNTGPALVIAGPGSGKTFVITGRIANLIQFYGVSPQSILTITFTKAAAAQMQRRAIQMIGTKANECAFGTFHSVFYKILQTEGYCHSGAVLSESEVYRILSDQIILRKIETDDKTELIKAIRSDISRRKIAGAKIHCNCLEEELFEQIFCAYCTVCIKYGRFDFDDLILICGEMFRNNPDILKRWQGRFRYIQVDEFQDIDQKQYEVIRMLAGDRRNLFVVGDDDQSIYSFRGADPMIMQMFEEEHDDIKRYLLDINYRCAKNILLPAISVIDENKKRYEKKIKIGSKQDGEFHLIEVSDDAEQAKWIAQKVMEYQNQDKTIGVLSRTTEGLKKIALYLQKNEVKFQCREVLLGNRNHFITKDILAYLVLAYGQFSRERMLRIMNKPDRGISRILLNDVQSDLNIIKENAKKYNLQSKQLEHFWEQLSMIAKMSPSNGMKYILRGCGYEKYLKQLANNREVSFKIYQEVLDDLQTELQSCRNRTEFLREFCDLQENNDNTGNIIMKNNGHNIVLSTLHGVKGLEYDIVFIPDMYQGNIPYKKAMLTEQLEEERRLFYVGMTRAKEKLFLVFPKKFRQKESSPSTFLMKDWETEKQ